MKPEKIKLALLFFVGALAGMLAMFLFKTYKIEKRDKSPKTEVVSAQRSSGRNTAPATVNSANIDHLTAEQTVISYVKENQRLPDYYLTKSQARQQGWVASAGNLCDVLPGKAIGGDKFSNREKQLPNGGRYFEADVNYNCGNRGADRIVYTENGEVWLTHDHYKSFEKQ